MRWNPFRPTQASEEALRSLTEKRGVSFQDVWGQGRDAAFASPMALERAITLAPVYSATSMIAGLTSCFPIDSLRTIKGVTEPMDPPATLLTDPTQFGGPIDWVHRAAISMALRGNAFGMVTLFTDQGYPRQIEWLHPDEVSLRTDRSVAAPQWFWLGKPVDNSRFVHIPLYTVPGRILGLSPIKAFAKTIDQGLLAQNYGVDWFRNGTVPAGMLTSDQRVNADDADTIAARWRRSAAGRGTPVVGQGLVYKAISVPPEESQFLATIKATATQVAAIYHIPAELIGGETGKSMTYTNVDGYPITVARFALMDYVCRIEAALTRYMPRPQSARFDMDQFQRPDMLARVQAYDLALKDQWMTVDEVRQNENLKPFGGTKGGILQPQLPLGQHAGFPTQGQGSGSGGRPHTDPAPMNDTPNDGVGKGGPNPEPKNTGAGQGAVDSHSLSNGNGHKNELDPRRLKLALIERENGWN